MSRPSLFELENHSDFIQRHIGPTVKQQTEMARAIGYDSLDALIDDTVPAAIRRSGPMELPGPRTEQSVITRLREIARLNVKDDVIVTTSAGETLHVPFYLVDEFARPACFACSDFSNEFADLSFGGLGSPGGYTTVLVRSSGGERIYNAARNAGTIQELTFASAEGRRNHATEMMAKIASFTSRKRERARERMEM